jgi:hypothetical protein
MSSLETSVVSVAKVAFLFAKFCAQEKVSVESASAEQMADNANQISSSVSSDRRIYLKSTPGLAVLVHHDQSTFP